MVADPNWNSVFVADHLSAIEATTVVSQDLLKIVFDGDQGSTVFTDLAVGHPIAYAGNARIAANAGPFGNSCLILDASNSYVETQDTSDLYFTAGLDINLECWVKFTTISGNQVILEFGTELNGFCIRHNGTNVTFTTNNGNAGSIGTPVANTWYHIAVSKAGGLLRCFWNGTKVIEMTPATTTWNTTGTSCRIGCGKTQTSYQFLGYISDLSIKKGIAIRTANFSVPTSPMETTFLTDLKGNQFYVVGSPTVSGSPAVPGGCLYFNGTSYLKSKSRIITPTRIGSVFTIDFWANVSSLSVGGGLFAFGDLVSGNNRTQGGYSTDGSVNFYNTTLAGTTEWNIVSNPGVISVGTWNYFQYVKNSKGAFLYVNGALVASLLDALFYPPSTSVHLFIGTIRESNLSRAINGYIQDFRITTGVDRSALNYIVPTSVFSEDGNTLFLQKPTIQSSYDFNYSEVSFLTKFFPSSADPGVDLFREFLIYGNSMEGSANQTSSIAEDTLAYTLTCNGNAKLVSPGKVGNTCLRLPGAVNDYAYRSGQLSNLQFDFGGDDFTIECWFQITNDSILQSDVNRHATLIGNMNSSVRGWYFAILGNTTNTGTGFLMAMRSNSSGSTITSSVLFPNTLDKNQWYHGVLQIESGVVCFFLDGVPLVGRRDMISYPFADSTQTIKFGKNDISGYEYYFNGLIDDARIYRTKAKYSTKFILPTALPDYRSATSDSLESFVILNMRMEGTAGDTSFLEEKSHVTTGGTGLVLSLAKSRYGGTSLYFPPGNTGLTLNSHADWTFAALDFCIEFWFYTVTAATRQVLFSDPYDYGMLLEIGSDGKLSLKVSYDGSSWVVFQFSSSGDTTVPLDAWNHVAVSRKGSKLFLYLNGFLERCFVVSSNAIFRSATNSMLLGVLHNGTNPFLGYIDDFRITKGASRYSSDFIPLADPVSSSNLQMIKGNASYTRDCDGAVYRNLPSLTQSTKKWGTKSIGMQAGKDTNQFFRSTGESSYVFGTGDFTVEGWFYFLNSVSKVLIDFYTTSQMGWQLSTSAGSKLTFWTSSLIVTGNGSVPTGTWLHIAVCRKNGLLYLFLDGVLDCTPTSYTANISYQATHLSVGAQYASRNNSLDFKGYISEVRVTKGVGRYTASFTPATEEFPTTIYPLDNTVGRGIVNTFVGGVYPEDVSPKLTSRAIYFSGDGYLKLSHASFAFGLNDFTIEAFVKPVLFSGADVYWDSVVFLSHMDGVDNGTSFSDVRGKTFTTSGSPVTKTGIFKFGTASAYFSGGAYLKVASTPDFDFGSGPFTIEFFVFLTTIPTQVRALMFGTNGSANSLQFAFYPDGGLWCGEATTNSPISGLSSVAGSYTVNTWAHIAFVWESTTTYALYVNGVQKNRTTTGKAWASANREMSIGADWSYGVGITGYIDEVRVTKGVARYLANFTVPTSSFPETPHFNPIFGAKWGTTKWNLSLGDSGKSAYFFSDFSGTSIKNFTMGQSLLFFSNTWSHIALVRKGNYLYLFVDGVLAGQKSGVSSWNFTGGDLYFGAVYDSINYVYFKGWMDSIRISNSARYEPNALPSTQFADTIKNISGIVRNDAGVPVSRKVFLHDRSTGSLVGATVSDSVTGLFSIPAGVKCYAVVLDDDEGTTYDALILDNITPK